MHLAKRRAQLARRAFRVDLDTAAASRTAAIALGLAPSGDSLAESFTSLTPAGASERPGT
jgi:hypothetical protein